MTQQYIEHKYKDVPPAQTIETIRNILKDLGIELEDRVSDSGTGDCFSAHVQINDSYPMFSNGKGVTADLARASAYAEFIERLQCGLLFYKLQSFNRNAATDLQTYAPDSKFMTMQELEETSDWMDLLIEAYGHGLTRKKIVKLCKAFACVDDDKILTVPYYSLFEDKYVYMPAAFVEHIYSSNGCCAGNSREEAWVHAFSEMMERYCGTQAMLSGKAMPDLTETILERVPLAKRVYDTVRSTGKYDIRQFDLSNGSDFPVIGTRIINKDNQRYLINNAADPIFEIAVSRGLTEILQGHKLDNIGSIHDGTLLTNMQERPLVHNLLNQLETGNGQFTIDFFAEEVACDREPSKYADNTGKTNAELLEYTLDVYRKLGKPVYVRNYSFLGFHSYHFVVPGFSELKWPYLIERISEYVLGDEAAKYLRDPAAASDDDLRMMLAYYKMISGLFSRRQSYARLTGVPLTNEKENNVLWITLAYAAYRTNDLGKAFSFLDNFCKKDTHQAGYFRCVRQYLTLTKKQADPEKIRVILDKFHRKEYVEELYANLAKDKTPFDAYLPRCDFKSCSNCPHSNLCSLSKLNYYIGLAGARYREFINGQDRSVFQV